MLASDVEGCHSGRVVAARGQLIRVGLHATMQPTAVAAAATGRRTVVMLLTLSRTGCRLAECSPARLLAAAECCATQPYNGAASSHDILCRTRLAVEEQLDGLGVAAKNRDVQKGETPKARAVHQCLRLQELLDDLGKSGKPAQASVGSCRGGGDISNGSEQYTRILTNEGNRGREAEQVKCTAVDGAASTPDGRPTRPH